MNGLPVQLSSFSARRFLCVSVGTVAFSCGAGCFCAFWRGGQLGKISHIFFVAGNFYGRLLYYRDALPVILKHPLGLGYLGYFETQGSFQTGVYTVMHVHNDLLQIFLDAGWLPGILCIVSFVRMLTGGAKKKGAEHRLPLRMIVTVIVLHSLLDFDLQFVSVVFVLLLCMADLSPEKELYKQTGDDESAEYCLKKMQAIPEMMEEVREGTSFFGWRIKDKPVF